MLRQWPIRQAGYMHADRIDIANKRLAKGVGSVHARKRRLPLKGQVIAHTEFKLGAGRYPDAGYMKAIDLQVRQLPVFIESRPKMKTSSNLLVFMAWPSFPPGRIMPNFSIF